MSNLQKRKEGGFTIIEVLIVLAIAGLIMLIVFLAVPALQRNSRNTQRKNDASAVASAIANFISNNGGTLPAAKATDSSDTSAVDLCASTCGSGVNYESAKLGYYTPANVSVTATPPASNPTKDTMVVVTGYNCNSTNTGIGTASSRTAAVLYAVESGGGTSQQCVEQ